MRAESHAERAGCARSLKADVSRKINYLLVRATSRLAACERASEPAPDACHSATAGRVTLGNADPESAPIVSAISGRFQRCPSVRATHNPPVLRFDERAEMKGVPL